jgi:hypothetical protein
MSRLIQVTRAAAGTLILLLMSASSASTQQVTKRAQRTDGIGSAQAPAGRVAYLKAFVIDDRLSALRREPGVQSQVIRRLRLGHPVFIVSTNKSKASRLRFCRVAVTRRTRGWIHESALAVQSRPGEDQRIMNLIEFSSDGVDKIMLCRIIIERFSQSRLVPRAMLLLGEEAEHVAETLSRRTRRRLAEVRGADASLRDYCLSDAGLDRYSRLGVVFDFNESTGEFVYDGKAYREIVRRFPEGEEAKLARQRLDLTSRKTARQR